MSIHTTDAIILRERDLRETSVLVTFYTRDFGKIRGLLKGVRGPKGPLGYQIQPFTLNKIVFYESKKADIHIVSQCDLTDFFEDIRKDIVKTGYAYYFVELVDALTESNEKSIEVFDLLLNSLNLLKTGASPKRVARILEIKLLAISGVMPRLDRCVACGAEVDVKNGPLRFSYKFGGLVCAKCGSNDTASRRILAGTVNFIDHVGRASYDKAENIKVSKDVGEELEEIMGKFLTYQLDTRIKSLDFLRSIEH
ncbi:MAG: DNA repair protein RecO [Candidatus Omnitrophica bacterium]|nr:DNA repair protein RecO [Candidatus Omnitrophota bacterium]